MGMALIMNTCLSCAWPKNHIFRVYRRCKTWYGDLRYRSNRFQSHGKLPHKGIGVVSPALLFWSLALRPSTGRIYLTCRPIDWAVVGWELGAGLTGNWRAGPPGEEAGQIVKEMVVSYRITLIITVKCSWITVLSVALYQISASKVDTTN